MRILRIKRGYTTNSSSGNEWSLPPRDHPQYREFYEYLEREGRLPPGTPKPLPTVEKQATPPSAPDKTATNLGLIGILLAIVCTLFALGALLRRLLPNKRERS